MLAVHRILGLSDEINTPMPGNRLTPFYNVALVLAFYGGVMAYSIHTILMAYRGWGWVIVKAAVLAVGWTAMLVALGGC